MKISSFEIEHKRTKLATNKKFSALRKFYSLKYPEITDLNSASFWDKRQSLREPLAKQDAMTRERVNIAANYLPNFVKQILDIGIGHGWLEERLEKKDIKFHGNDISPKTIKNIKARFKGNFAVKSIYNLSYKKNNFEAVFLLEVLEHIPPSKTFQVLESIRKLLLPGGYFILSVPTNEGLEQMPNNPSGHVRMYTVPLITAELEMSGFRVLKVKTLFAFNKYVVLKKFIAQIVKNKWQPNDIVILAKKTI